MIMIFVVERWGKRGDIKGGPEGWAPKGGSPKGGDRKKFAIFSFSPPQLSFFLPSLGGLLVEFWWCLKRGGSKMFMFGLSTTKIQREDPKEKE